MLAKVDTGTRNTENSGERERERDKWTCSFFVISELKVDLVLFICGLTSNHCLLISLLRRLISRIFSSFHRFLISSCLPSHHPPHTRFSSIFFSPLSNRYPPPIPHFLPSSCPFPPSPPSLLPDSLRQPTVQQRTSGISLINREYWSYGTGGRRSDESVETLSDLSSA